MLDAAASTIEPRDLSSFPYLKVYNLSSIHRRIMEDFNIPSAERVAILQRLQEVIGGAPLHFWAACQICELEALAKFVKCGREYPEILRGFTQQTYPMICYCM